MLEVEAGTTLGPALNSTPYGIAEFNTLGFTVSYNCNGPQLALQQALDDVLSADIKDVFKDYAVAICLQRNNSSIPVENQMQYPVWMFSSNNPSPLYDWAVNYDNYFDLGTLLTDSITYWDMIDNPTGPNNIAYFIDSGFPEYAEESLYPSWPRFVAGSTGPVTRAYNAAGSYVPSYDAELTDMSLVTWWLPDSFTGAHVTANSGEIHACVVKFTSDPSPPYAGTFQMDGWHSIANGATHDFDLTPFVAQTPGYTKLIIVNTNITDIPSTPSNPIPNFVGCTYNFTGDVTVEVDF
jgi:hypothetical protein